MNLRHPYLRTLAEQREQYGGVLEWTDLYAAQWLLDTESAQRELRGLAALSDRQTRLLAQAVIALQQRLYQGYVYLSLREEEAMSQAFAAVNITALRAVLKDAVCCVTTEERSTSQAALVEHDHRLYMGRWWREYCTLTAHLVPRLQQPPTHWSQALRGFYLRVCRLPDFEDKQFETACHAQHMAIAHALTFSLTLVSGGPGTGKTTTAARMLQALVFQYRESEHSRSWPTIRLLAPTGKAAVRLESAILAQLSSVEDDLDAAASLAEQVQGSSMTIHRFLAEQGALDARRAMTGEALQASVWHGNSQRLAEVDIVIVDESSMLDLKLANKLLGVLPATCRLVFLGDPYQLPPVEPGAVFSDWVTKWRAGEDQVAPAARVRDWTTHPFSEPSSPLCSLNKTFRFDGELKQLADAVRKGQVEQLLEALSGEDVTWYSELHTEHLRQIRVRYCGAYKAYFELASQGASARALAAQFSQFQLLGAQYEGVLGVQQFNRDIEQKYRGQQEWYHGKVILVTRNQPELGIFNGDIGYVVACVTEEGERWYEVHFPDLARDNEPLVVSPSRLRNWQPAYAMTVHKSQGSEYDAVMCVLAPYGEDLLTRALLYTAVTRAKQRCELVADLPTLKKLMAKTYALTESD